MLRGELTITRSGNTMNIELKDELSRTRIATIEISAKDLMLGLTSLADQPCMFEVNPGLAGHKREVDRVNINVGEKWRFTPEELNALAAPYEVDGWIVRRDDITNHHNRNKDNTVTVVRTRFVNTETGEPVR